MRWSSPGFWIGLLFVLFTMSLFGIIVWRQLGGDTTLGVIIGHIAAWVQMVALFYFRKKPPTEKPSPSA